MPRRLFLSLNDQIGPELGIPRGNILFAPVASQIPLPLTISAQFPMAHSITDNMPADGCIQKDNENFAPFMLRKAVVLTEWRRPTTD
jgi:hypothetical protein